MKTWIGPSADAGLEVRRPGPPVAALRKAANRIAFAVVALSVLAIFTAICVGVALAAALLSMS